jgi:nucleotide-binding universal stress UspA family protein
MYRSIHVPVDNSDHSNAAVELAVAFGRAFGGSVVGSHVYAARLHDVRFKQMEFTLPDEYKEEEELEKQRKIHDALIARGLHLISDSYLDQAARQCAEAGVGFERKHFDGKNFEAIVEDVNGSPYDLLVMGALGMGAVRDSQVGSVCERVLRRTRVDALVVRDPAVKDAAAPGPVVACLDGSAGSYGAVVAAIAVGRAFGRDLVVLAADDGDAGAAGLLASHLGVVEELARRHGLPATTRLLSGAARTEIRRAVDELRPWLLVAGRTGLDATESADLGTIAEHLVRTSPSNVLLVGRAVLPAEALTAVAA